MCDRNFLECVVCDGVMIESCFLGTLPPRLGPAPGSKEEEMVHCRYTAPGSGVREILQLLLSVRCRPQPGK